LNEPKDFLARLVAKLNQVGMPFMVVGSLASGFHGTIRSTNDFDLVIAPSAEQLGQFLDCLGPDYYVSSAAAWQALAQRSMFNVVDFQAGWKADLIIRKDRPFDLAAFCRRQVATVLETSAPVGSAEDTILSKLEWAKQSESERQLRDALGVVAIQRDNLDREYLSKWAQELGVADLLQNVLREADKLNP
jgi:hypothetical protein